MVAVLLPCRSVCANAECDSAAGRPGSLELSIRGQDGVSWLMTPCGERFFSVGINGIDQSLGAERPIENIATETGRGIP